MFNVDLSTLRGQELRQLLDSTRRRGDAAVSYEILQEMAVRRERGEPEARRGLFGPKRPAELRVIELNLGDPLDPKDPELEESAPPTPADWELEAVEDDDDATYLHRPAEPEFDDAPPAPKPRRRALWLSAGLALGLVVGLALGGWAESVSRQTHPAPLTIAAAAPPPARAAAAPAADPIAVETETAPATPPPPPPPVAAAPLPPAAAAIPAPEAASPSQPAAEVAEETAPDTAKASAKETVKATAVSTDAQSGAKTCSGQPTPADRIICGTPRLQRLQKDLREAYADALDAHQDRDLLREHQLAWREARNTVTEPERLAQLYEERIRKLKAATAEALKAR